MFKSLRSIALAGACLLPAAVALADTLFEQGPVLSELNGVQSDGNTPPYLQSFNAALNSDITSIVWWGFHGQFSTGADAFELALDNGLQSGSLSSTVEAAFADQTLTRYTFDLGASFHAGASTVLSIINNSVDAEWYWQRAAGPGGAPLPGTDPDFPVAFRVLGTTVVSAVPEPEVTAMLLAGLIGVSFAVWRRRR